ncbi:MAG: caspase family protein [Candidatus Xenobia bacterium]
MGRSSWLALVLIALLAVAASAAPQPELLLQNGHARYLVNVAFGAKGDVVATGSGDQTARLWDLHGRVLGIFSGHVAGKNRGGVYVALSPNEKTLATGGQDGKVKLWDVATGQVRATIKAGDNYSGALVCFSPDGKTLAMAQDGVQLVDVATGTVKQSLGSTDLKTLDLAFNRDGSRLAVFSTEGDIKVWSLPAGAEAATMHTGTYSDNYGDHGCVAFLPDGDLITASNTVTRWKGSQKVQEVQMDGPQVSIAVSPDGKTLAVVHDGVLLCDPDSLQTIRKVDAPNADGVAFSPDGRTLAVSQYDAHATLWQLGAQPKQIADLAGHSRMVFDIGVHGRTLTAVDAFGAPTRWDLLSGRALPVGQAARSKITAAAISADQRHVAIGHFDGEVELFDTTTRKRAWKGNLAARRNYEDVSRLAFSSDGKLLAGANVSGVIGLWQVSDGQHLSYKQMMDSNVIALAFSPDGRTLAASGVMGDKTSVLEFAVDRDRLLKAATHPVYNWNDAMSLAYTPDNRSLLAGTAHGNLAVYQSNSDDDGHMLGPQPHGEATKNGFSYTIAEPDARPFVTLAVSPDGHTVATGDDSGNLQLWDLTVKKQIKAFRAHAIAVESVQWIDAHTLVSASDDTSVKFWRMPEGRLLATAVSLNDGQDWVVTAPDGRFDGSPGGQRLIQWRIGDKKYELEQFFNSLYTPGLLGQQLRLKTAVAAPVAITHLKVPPRVHIESPEVGDSFKTPQCTVRVKVQDEGGGVGQTALYLNGHRLPSSRAVTSAGGEVTFKIELVPGSNVLRASAFNGDNSIESHADEVEVSGPAASQVKPRLWVLAVGIDRYQNGLSLGFADADAKAIAGFFKPGLFASVTPVLLTDKQASRAAVLAAFQKLVNESQPQDTVVIYLAGHGTLVGDVFYYLPWDAKVGTDDDIRSTGVSSVMLGSALADIPATKQVLVLDACHSGGSTGALVKMLASRDAVDMERAQQRLARASGSFLISAATAQQYAKEFPELGHGVLTYAILHGLGEHGKPAAGTNSDGQVTVNGLLHYLSDEVPALAEKYHGGRQDVVQFSTGQDFPLVVAH